MKAKKKRVHKKPVELPADYTLPGPTSEYMQLVPSPGVTLGIDPAGLSGWTILVCDGIDAPTLHSSGSVEIFRSRVPDEVVRTAAGLARELGVELRVVTEHSKNAYGSGTFGVSGFIGMMRAQGAWKRVVELGCREWIAEHGNHRVGRRTGIKPGMVLVGANQWRADVFGTTRFKAGGKSHALRREHWKAISVGAAQTLHPVERTRDDNESEAILIAHWGARQSLK